MEAYIDKRLRSDKPITFLEFIEDVKRLWELAEKPGKFVRDKPFDDDAQFPVVTFRVIRRLVNPEFKEIKPRLRATIEHPYMEGEWIELYGQMFDVWIEFNIYSLSAEQADQMVMELEDFLVLYTGFFKKSGVHEIRFFAQAEDEVITDSRFAVAKRSLQYTVRFDKITPLFLNQIESIAVQAEIMQQENKDGNKEEKS